ncbi:DEAD/DEAH box helicase [Tumebacillus permanentifrigoris]|uniref:SNF2 family DNA or RNA helicase n=1 Tax=Tumebacillus permanentifrigoris TaxID=378543 RepID=A0A316DE83_9BACL|nr:DEAD/DEAH box helicase [Tumebacillus permanentifrigoris]PWK16511.1 SNF2 family DNA or RNA helicase [Tumebacillus permanentifrigoris]
MRAPGTIVLQGRRQPTGELFLWATGESGEYIPPQRCKSLLFAWDKRSFYGTLIEIADIGETSGLLLPPFTAVLFLAQPQPSRLAAISWSPELLHEQQLARLYVEALEQGWFVPSYERWLAGSNGWKLRIPDEVDRSALDAVSDANEWFQAVVLDLVSQDTAVADSFAELLRAYSILDLQVEPEVGWVDEEQWLVAIGWQRDEVPFRTSIQLVEPEEGQESWHLRLLLQDVDNQDLIVEMDFQGRPLAGQLPEHWQADLEPRIALEAAKLKQIVPWLPEATFTEQSLWELDDEQAWSFMNEDSLQLIRTGSSVFLPAWWEDLRSRKPRLRAKITSSVGTSGRTRLGLQQLVDFDWKLAVGDLELSEAEFSRILAEKKRLAFIRGQWIQLDREFLHQMTQTFNRVNKKKGLSLRDVLEMYWLQEGREEGRARGQADPTATANEESEWNELLLEVELNAHLQEFVDQLQQVSSLPLVTPPAELHATLRHYQQEGVSWLLFLRKYGLGCCLADDMGLGKTIQFITYLLCAKQEGTTGPSLLVCPTSVMGNWEKELHRFAPGLTVHVHYGAQRAKGEELRERAGAADLVITSYTLAHLDQEELSQIHWDALCLDEAQNIKNAYTKQRIAIRQLEANHRIALTGTPIENRLTELWSIYDFLNPGFLGSLKSFTETYVNQIERHNDPQLIEQVQKLIRPFLLRRVKKDPAIQLDLPEKNEMKVYVSLTAEQGALYENVVQDLFEKLDTLSGMEKKGLILSSLTKLKQLCDHPALFLKDASGGLLDERSNKLDRLLEMVEELREEGDQCLIFTQYVEMGHLLQNVIEERMGESVLFLHGGVPKTKRDQLVARFQDPEVARQERPGIFVLSLKAGGTGLNLTAATHVFHFDRWWNPAVEDQATDRAFRIGQTRDVQVHKFVTLGTLEERIDEMIEHKQGLSRQIVGGNEQWITEMSTQELKDLFALRTEWIGK